MIRLGNLLTEETFTATNKASGKTSVFKSKDSRDAAVKAGTHTKVDDKTAKSTKPTVNIFDKPTGKSKEEPKSDTSKETPSKIKSKEEVYSKFDSLQNNPDALQKYIESEVLPYIRPNDKALSTKYVKGEIEILKNPKASTSKKNKSEENIKQIVTNVLNYNLEKDAEKRAIKMGWPLRFGKSKEKANPSNMKSKDELISKINSLTGDKFEEYVIREIIPYLDDRDTLILNTLFINSTQVGNDKNNYESFLKKMVKDKIQSAFKSNDTSTKKSTNSPSLNNQINFGDFESLDGITHSTDVSDLIDSNENIFSKEDKNKLYSLQSNLEQAEEDDNDNAVDKTIYSIHNILKKYMTETKGNISIIKLLSNLLTEETFTATNKSSGKTSVFKSKDSRDAAVKAGTHTKKDTKSADTSKTDKTPKVNIFDKPAKGAEPTSTKSTTISNMGVDKVVYNTRTKTVGIVRMADERGETKTDADGNVNTSELEPYNPMKYPHQKDAKVAPSTQKEVDARGLWTPFAPDGNSSKEEPKKDEPKSQQPAMYNQRRTGKPEVNKAVKNLAEEEGFTPDRLGKEEYKTKMMQAAVSALTDANFHQEARELVAKLEGKPEWAKKPEYPSMNDPEYTKKMQDIRTNSSDASEYMQPDNKTWAFGREVSKKAGWGGVEAIDGLAFTLRMNGFHKDADAIQSIFDDKPYMKNEGRISLSKLVKIK
jgi:hypothetical protein